MGDNHIGEENSLNADDIKILNKKITEWFGKENYDPASKHSQLLICRVVSGRPRSWLFTTSRLVAISLIPCSANYVYKRFMLFLAFLCHSLLHLDFDMSPECLIS